MVRTLWFGRFSAFARCIVFLLGIFLTTSAVIQTAWAQQVLTLTATNADGVNTGTARLSSPVSFTTSVTAGKYGNIAWTLQGAGSITILNQASGHTAATYTPPAAMPANASVTLTAYLASEPSVAVTYPFTLVNPIPTVASASPAQLLTGGTQPVTVVGSGFVPTTAVSLGGTSLATSYVSASQLSVQVPVAASATGTLALQVQNPGVSATAAFSESVATNSIAISSNLSGTNPTLSSGATVNFSAAVTGSVQTAVNWSVSGAGTISSTGVYVAPVAFSSSSVVVTATLASNSAITAAYPLTLSNPAPTVGSASPAQLLTGGTQTVTLSGSGFIPATTVTLGGTSLATSYVSSNQLSVQVPVAANATGSIALLIQNPGVSTTATVNETIATAGITLSSSLTGANPTVLAAGTASFSAAVTGSVQTTVNWTVNGSGTISAAGIYTAPVAVTNTSVVVTATLASNSSITASFPFTLVLPSPVVTSAGPTQLQTGGTQVVTVIGSGFLPTSSVTLGGNTLNTTYVSATQLTVQVPVPVDATGTLALQVQNPGAGAAAVFSETVAANTIAVTSASVSGSSPTLLTGGTATFTATVTGSMQTAVNWSISGAGSISSAGLYTAPATMPSSAAVTITATLASNTSITGTFALTLNTALPTITKANPTTAVAGATIPITLTGTNFESDTVVLVNNSPAPTTYVSPTSVTVQVTAPAGSSTALSVLAQNPSPMSGVGTAFSILPQDMQLVVLNADGTTNNGQLLLGGALTMTASIANSNYSAKTWNKTGGGMLVSSGTNSVNATYTAPTTMPTSPTITVTVALSSYSAVMTTYTITLQNPGPTVTSASPTQLLTAGTQTVTFGGTNFVQGSTVYLNGTALTTTYLNSGQVKASVPVGNTTTGNLSFVVQNPAPGGGSSAAYSVPVVADAIVIAPKDPTVTSVTLGGSLSLGATVTGSEQTAVTWSVSGGGTISAGGTYVAPTTMPTGSVVVTATLTSNPAITANYSPAVANPIPTLNSANPTQAVSGATVPIALNGKGFVPGTVILVNGVPATTTYTSATSVTAQIPAAPGASGNLSIAAQNAAPGGGTGAVFQLPIATLQLTATNPDGTNTGTARLGVPVSFTTTNTDTAHTQMSWTLQGAGTYSAGGTNNASATYTPPQSMPANSTVTLTAYLNTLSSLTTTYTMTLVNPIPSVTTASPSQLMTGGTQTVMLSGTGFIPGMTVSLNGTSYPTTFISYTSASVQIPVGASATGSLTLQVLNPAPGGGAGTTFTETIAATSLTLTATDADGTNTGTSEIGTQVAMSAAVAGSAQTAVKWSVSGPGSISSGGVYTAPTTMPSTQAVTIQAALASNSSVTASYSLNLINPIPTVTAASPISVPAGATTLVNLAGTGFVPDTVIEVNGTAVPTTYVSLTSIQAQITVDPSASGTLPVEAFNPSFTGGTSPFYPMAITAPISLTGAARLLDQTTFGPTTALSQQVQQLGATAWLTQQFNTPQTVLPVIQTYPSYCATAEFCLESDWWNTAITGNDQLRQRVALALSELFVVSSDDITGQGIDYYVNMLATDAFSNWYTIMNDVTMSPAMGIYLNMLNSMKPAAGLIANENFARENMQLFNMGLDLINQDGSPQLSGGNLQPAYTEAQVEAFSRVFTGWTYASSNGSTPGWFISTPNYYHPLVAVESNHDQTSKALLNGTTLSAGQSAEQDMAQALTNIFNHPNVPPFVSKQLIQHLVKSDPSPGYISRVAAVFINDGNNVRGDMQAVLTAIFTDPEARAGDTEAQPSDGHLREPILWLTAAMRGLGYTNVDPNNYWDTLSGLTQRLSERPFQSPAVFNFFPPDFVVSGTGLNAPEFGIENTASVTDRVNLADELTSNTVVGFNVDLSATSPLGQIAVSQGPAGLVSALNNLFLYGTMDSQTSAAITSEISKIVNPAQQVRVASYLVITSSEYKILH